MKTPFSPPLPGWICSRFDSDTIHTVSGGGITDPDIPFPLASVTKTFTAHLCMQPEPFSLLDQPFINVMPGFKLKDRIAASSMTPRDALCHFSGLPPHTADWVNCTLSRKAYIRDRLPHLDPAGPFREKHRYSNMLYAVLGQWLEEVRGISWELQITQDIIKKYGLRSLQHIDSSWEKKVPPPHALSHKGSYERIPPFFALKNHLIAPASEMLGSMPDLAGWGRMMLQTETEDPRWQPHNRVKTQREFPEFGPLDYGLGWRLDTVNGERRFWHSGQCSGYTTLLTVYPERKCGLAAAANCSGVIDRLQGWDLTQHHLPSSSISNMTPAQFD